MRIAYRHPIKGSLRDKLRLFIYAIFIPMVVMIMILFGEMIRFSNRYDSIVTNITRANDYNLSFEESMNYTMYRIVIGSAAFDQEDKEEGIVDPYALIKEAEETFTSLKTIASNDKSEKRIRNVLKHLNTLEDRIDEIKENVESPVEIGTYEENIFKLETNVYILTELIQEQIQEYIYYESRSMETVRKKINKDINNTLKVSVVVFAVLLLVTWFIARIIAESISKPLHALTEMTKLVGEGDFRTRALEDTGDEVKALTYHFNRMIEQIEGLINAVKQEHRNVREAELKLLQAQINPHFLYNTLDNILWLIEADRKENATRMITLLSEFFRTSLNKGKDIITIREEIEHVQSYLSIQQYRYQDIMDYSIEVDEEILTCIIPKLTLQPLVENAIYHGVKSKRGKGCIRIKGRIKEGKIYLIVEDNGKGIEAIKLRHLEEMLTNNYDTSQVEGFGIMNVNERIRLRYGKEYGLRIHSTLNKGTKVQVEFPIIRTNHNIT